MSVGQNTQPCSHHTDGVLSTVNLYRLYFKVQSIYATWISGMYRNLLKVCPWVILSGSSKRAMGIIWRVDFLHM